MPKISLNASKKTKLTAAGEIPVDWRCSKLGDLIAQPISGVSVLADEKPPERGQPGVLRLSCVTGGRFDPNDLKSPQNGQAKRLGVAAEHNTILISRSNTPNLVGESAYVSGEHPSAFLPDTLWLLRPKEAGKVSMAWLGYMLRSSHYRRLLKQIASGTSQSMKKIQKGALLKLHAATPPLPEQEKIAEILTTWDEALEKLDALIAAKHRRKKGLMQRVLTRSAAHSKAAHARHRLGEICERVTRRNTPGSENVLTISAQEGLVNQRDYFNRNVAGADLSKYYLLEQGEFAYNRSSSKGYPYGAIKRLDLYESGVVSTLYLCFRLKPKAQVSSAYLVHYFEGGYLNSGLRAVAKEGARAHGLLNVTSEDFFDLDVFLPTLAEQQRIADLLDTCDAELDLLRSQRDALDLQKRGLMQRLLTGKIRVKTGEPPAQPMK